MHPGSMGVVGGGRAGPLNEILRKTIGEQAFPEKSLPSQLPTVDISHTTCVFDLRFNSQVAKRWYRSS